MLRSSNNRLLSYQAGRFWMNIRNNNHIFVVAIILSSALSAGLEISHSIAYNNTAKATLFEINKSQFERAPEFTGTTGHINTLVPIKLADLKRSTSFSSH